MPRKTLLDVASDAKIAEGFVNSTAEAYERAKAVYDHQDAATKAAIDRVVETLRKHATGRVNVKVANSLVPIKVDDLTLGYHLFQLGVALVVDLAMVGLRLASFRFDPKLCASCGAKLARRKR